MVRGHNLRGAGVPGAPFDKGEAGRHVVHMKDDVGEIGVGDEVRVDRRIGCINLQFHDGLKDLDSWVLAVSERPGLRLAVVRKEREASYAYRRRSLGRIGEDVDGGSENLFFR